MVVAWMTERGALHSAQKKGKPPVALGWICHRESGGKKEEKEEKNGKGKGEGETETKEGG